MQNLLKNSIAAPAAVERSAHETSKNFSFKGTIIVQVLIINNEPHFVAVDVCGILGLSNTTDRLKNTLESSEYLPYVLHRSGQQRTVNVVTESGLYALIFQSRKPVAKEFRRWVTNEVLPSIRKTGTYSKTNLYPSKMQPTSCVVLDCYDEKDRRKQAYLYYDDSTWGGCPLGWGDRDDFPRAALRSLAEMDKDTVRYDAQIWRMKNGKYKKSVVQYFPTDKTAPAVKTNPIKDCENAIDKYKKAKVEVKDSAEKMITFLGE